MKAELYQILGSLKRNGKYSPTLLTMFTAWVTAMGIAWIDFFQSGFRSETFWAFVSIGAGIKITDAISKKLTPTLS